MTDLYQRSIAIMLDSQTESGAILASKAFPSYRYSWFRDSSFIAHALGVAGHEAPARRYFAWAGRTIQQHAASAERGIAKVQDGQPLGPEDYLHARYTPEGQVGRDLWWDFQLDGLGTWLWALAAYVQRTDDRELVSELTPEIILLHRYLTQLWPQPNYDCWEELSEYLHNHTLAAVHAGLCAAGRLIPELQEQSSATAAAIRTLMKTAGLFNGHFAKSFSISTAPRGILQGDQEIYHDAVAPETLQHSVDASLIGLATPYRIFPAADPHLQATLTRLESGLWRPGGGVNRYLADTYYGGGEWVVLAGWLGWHFAENGQFERARALKSWIEAQADDHGRLPEQVSDFPLAPDRLAEWHDRWGPIAKPLTWSHAMYVLTYITLNRKNP